MKTQSCPLQEGADLVQLASRFLSLIGIEGADGAVCGGEGGALAEEVDLDEGQVVGGSGIIDGRETGAGQRLNLVRHSVRDLTVHVFTHRSL